MAEFFTTRNTASHIEALIDNAKRQLTLISPYLQIPTGLLPRLRAADARGVETRLVFRTDKLNPEERDKLSELKRLSLFSLDHLHAKCYANEQEVLISSLNLYAYSEQHNWEMSVLLTESDGEAMRKARSEIDLVLRTATPHPTRPGIRSFLTNVFARPVSVPAGTPERQVRKAETRRGYCIRCTGDVRYVPQSPLCTSCYATWAVWGNEDYPERTCHRCAKPADVTKAKPLCAPCFREAPFSTGRF